MAERMAYGGVALVLAGVAWFSGEAAWAAHGHWLAIGAKAVLALLAGLACVVVLLMAWAVETPDSYLNDPYWCGLLFRDHPKRRLREWARSMRYFRFVRGSGGGMDDHGDRLAVLLRADAREEVDRIIAAVGATCRVGLSVYEGSRGLELSITDTVQPYAVTQAAVDSARSVESLLEPLAGKLIDPPQDDKYCICPKFYPSFWVDKPPRGTAR